MKKEGCTSCTLFEECEIRKGHLRNIFDIDKAQEIMEKMAKICKFYDVGKDIPETKSTELQKLRYRFFL